MMEAHSLQLNVCTVLCHNVLQVCEAFGMSHADITPLAEAVAPGAEGVNFLPYLLGERTPNWPHSSGAVLGLRQGDAGWIRLQQLQSPLQGFTLCML